MKDDYIISGKFRDAATIGHCDKEMAWKYGMSIAEIADMLQLTPQNVRSTLYRGLKRVRKLCPELAEYL